MIDNIKRTNGSQFAKIYVNTYSTMIFLFLALFTGCMVSIPSEKLINNCMSEFLIEADQIEGVYMNNDTDSIVFTYHTKIKSEKELRSALSTKLRKESIPLWRESTDSTNHIEFRRTLIRGRDSEYLPPQAASSSYEVVRIAFIKEKGKVIVAYIQADSHSDVSSFEETSEGKWAEKGLWPIFNKQIKESK